MSFFLLAERDVFANRHQVRPIKWSGYNLSRLLRRTGERPERVAEMWAILSQLGMGEDRHWLGLGGVFDHGEMWGRADDGPWCVVGHPYGINDERRELLKTLGRFPTLGVRVNDEPSYYGYGTDHVRIELFESRRPFVKPRSTSKIRVAGRAARRAFAEVFL